MTGIPAHPSEHRAVRGWLLSIAALIALMVLVGGASFPWMAESAPACSIDSVELPVNSIVFSTIGISRSSAGAALRFDARARVALGLSPAR